VDEDLVLTVDAAVELTNALAEGAGAEVVRAVLVDREFLYAPTADEAQLVECIHRYRPVADIVATLPEVDLDLAVGRLNDELAACNISPSLVAHDGYPLHIHWTGPNAPFGHKVVVDVLMGLSQTLCEEGLNRFGRCSAEGCQRLFYDATRNRSRRFCSDSRCASRTHTARHRARHRS
jgi:hypothetical protein